jgi:DNA-binding PadR family transcriptional regulator
VKKLSDDGLLEEIDDTSNDRRRRSYALTNLGARVLQAEADRLARSVADARRLRSAPSGRGGSR